MESMGPGWPRKDGYIVGYAIAVDGWKGYFPIAHKGGGNLDDRIVNRWMKKVLELPCDKIMHNAAYDLGWLRASGFTVNGTVYITDEPQTRGEVHAAQTLEYLCAYEPKYHTPPNRPGKEPWWVKWRAERLARQRKSEDPCILLAPTGSLKR